MPVLFAATELMDFVLTGNPSNLFAQTNSSYYLAANSRAGAQVGSGVEDVTFVEGAFTSTADIWVHFVVGWVTAVGTQRLVKLYSGGTNRLAFRFDGNGAIELSKWNGTAWVILGTSATNSLITTATPYVIDMHLTIGNPGRATIYFNGSPMVSSAAYDLTWSGVTGYDKIRFCSQHGSFQIVYSEVIVADFNTLNSKVVSRVPDANGTYTAWAGTTGTFADIDDAAGGTDFITGAADGDRESWTHTNFPALAANESIVYVGMGASALRDAAGPQSFNMFTRISTTDYDKANETVSVGYTGFQQGWLVSPATSAAWTIAELDAAEFGVRART